MGFSYKTYRSIIPNCIYGTFLSFILIFSSYSILNDTSSNKKMICMRSILEGIVHNYFKEQNSLLCIKCKTIHQNISHNFQLNYNFSIFLLLKNNFEDKLNNLNFSYKKYQPCTHFHGIYIQQSNLYMIFH